MHMSCVRIQGVGFRVAGKQFVVAKLKEEVVSEREFFVDNLLV